MTRTHHTHRDKRMLMLGILFVAAAGLLMAGTTADASPGHHGWKKGKRGKARAKRINRMFNRLDANKDGLLSKAELANAPRRLKRRLAGADLNGDSMISKREIRRAIMKRRRGRFGKARRRGHFGKARRRGKLGTARRGRRMRMRARRLFRRLDVDNSGTLTRKEIASAPSRAARFLARADLNKDGVVTKRELRTTLRNFMRRRMRHRHRGHHKHSD